MITGRQIHNRETRRREAVEAASEARKASIAEAGRHAIERKQKLTEERRRLERAIRLERSKVEMIGGTGDARDFERYLPLNLTPTPWGTIEIPEVLAEAIAEFMQQTIESERVTGEMPDVNDIRAHLQGKHLFAALNDRRFRDYFYDLLTDAGLTPEESWLPTVDGYRYPENHFEKFGRIAMMGGRR